MDVGDGATVVAPTLEEALRVKAFLIVQRNYVRGYLDVVALADHIQLDRAAEVLRSIDDHYQDRSNEWGSVLTALVAALAEPDQKDTDVIDELPRYEGLNKRYHDGHDVVAVCRRLALDLSGATG